MATTINIHEAKTHLSRYIERVRAGEEVIIAKAGRPTAKLVPIPDETARRRPGIANGKVTEAFFEPLPEAAQSRLEQLPLASSDPAMALFGIALLR